MAPNRNNWTRWLAGLGLPAGAGLLAAARVAGDGGSRGSWASQALLSGPFLLAAGVTLLAGVILILLAVAMWRSGASVRAAASMGRRGQDGTAMIEFALVFPFALLMVLLMVQGALLMAGNLCVHYAAFCAARASATSVPLDYSPAEPPNVVDLANPDGSAKLRRVKMAAVYAVMPVSCGDVALPDLDIVLKQSLRDYFGKIGQPTPHWVEAMIGRKWGYAESHTRVELAAPLPPGSQAYGPSDDLTVTVNHTFYLAVPYARRIFAAAGGDGVTMDLGNGAAYGTRIRATSRLTNEGVQDYVDVERWP